ncbi:hypothetical protein ACLE20_07040 [Rhizobium sp. YIM 134829]|uniref:hypothetical protein n=1 Tax=Rhizobium sp. YIM 134829 TaxID=3390453 RepID=UPI00397855D9
MEVAYLAPDRILAHPKFGHCRNLYISDLLALYEFRPDRVELLLDAGRIMVYAAIMALWGGYRDNDRSSLPTVGRLKRTVDLFQIASPRQIDRILSRFAQVGHIETAPVADDLRMRIVLPTAALIAHDRAFIRVHYAALGELVACDAYARPLAGDLVFLKAIRSAWIAALEPMAKDILPADPQLYRFYAASAGMMILFKLVDMQALHPGRFFAVDHSELARRFGVSRTHVGKLLKTAAADGGLEREADGRLRLDPSLLRALDRNIAGRLSLLDRAHAVAVAELDAAGTNGLSTDSAIAQATLMP